MRSMVEGRERSELMRASRSRNVDRAKQLRRTMTLPEVLLWRALRARPGGHRFRRQHPYGPYVLDFFCAGSALCIEVDGASHDMSTNPERDMRRDQRLHESGIRTIRVLASDVLQDIEPVVLLIQQECASRSPSTGYAGPPPLQRQGRIW